MPLVLIGAGPGQAKAEKPIIAVFNIEDRGVGLSRKMLLRLSDFLAMKLAATGAYQLVPRDQLKKRLTQQKVSSFKKCYAQTCQIEIGKELAAQKSLATSIMKLGSKCMVTSVMYDLRKSASEGGASAAGKCNEDGIVASIQTLVTKLMPRSKVVAPKSTRPRDRGGVLIKTRPKGASVKMDGVPVKGTTPLTITDLAPGEHLLEITKGDDRYTGKVLVKADDYTTVNLALKKARVRLEVVSDPPEATILLNGMEMGRTPKILPPVKAGEHVIELQKEGYLSEKQSLRLGAATSRQTIRLSLKKAAFLTVQSDPAGARVEVDGVVVGTTPIRVAVGTGDHGVKVDHPGRRTATRKVSVAEGAETKLSLRLDLSEDERQRMASMKARLREQALADVRYKEELKAYEERYGNEIRERRSKSGDKGTPGAAAGCK
jgi:hypothetical protein